MKTSRLTMTGVAMFCCLGTIVTGQNNNPTKTEGKEILQEIKREVRVEEKNGLKTMTLITTSNGEVTEEVFTGEEAEKKLAEMDPQSELNQERKEVEYTVDGEEKRLVIRKEENGEITEEVYTGAEAEEKAKVYYQAEGTPAKVVIKEEKKAVRNVQQDIHE